MSRLLEVLEKIDIVSGSTLNAKSGALQALKAFGRT